MTLPDAASLIGLGRSLAIYYGRPWKSAELRRFTRELVGPGDLAFDIGAHVGNRSRALVAAGARVVALEPQPLFRAVLRRLLPPGTVILPEAVGSREGRMTLNVSRRHPTVSTLSTGWIAEVSADAGFRKVAWDRAIEVDVTTLDRLIERYGRPRFIKIDVEGLEPEILAGLSQPVPMVAFEYLPAALHGAEACIARLQQLGDYVFNRVEGERHRFLHDDWMAGAAMLRVLHEAAGNGRSGDVYARLRASESTPGSAPTTATSP
ncbi:FkbM family methyltransferase [Chthonobacter albigriseus]|uniref:FkbM family methyltransferase n=1 Tax=Chthonobacter albigriseus TaxID=1683161 RepID=UPI0015EF285C|nr:FkbM family methyltransferase [Chthonobacter albigriseus]